MENDTDTSIVWAHATHVSTTNELLLVEAELRGHGVPYFIPERNVEAIYPQYVPPGGFSLLVKPEDVARVRDLLTERGVEVDQEHEGSELLEWLDQWSRPLPIIGRMHVVERLLILGAAAALIYILVVSMLMELR